VSTAQAIVLGIVQGLAEFLPISSSGHLELTRWLFEWDFGSDEIEQAFDVAVHIGTLFGVLIYLRKDIVTYVKAGLLAITKPETRSTTDARIAWLLIASMIPAGITGVALKDVLSSDRHWLIAVMLIVFGLVLLWADRLRGTRETDDFRLRDALIMGVGQAMALQPGVSRSGATMTMARVVGFNRESAARLAFLMSVPIIAGAGVFQAIDVSVPSELYGPFLWGMLSSAITGYLAVWGTMTLIKTRTFMPFVAYRIVVGIAVLLILASGWR
jgi:undecaprenyl-diphosphatase